MASDFIFIIMTPLYTKEEFDNAKSRDVLSLKCENCYNIFSNTKNRIQDKIKGQKTKPLYGSFCSIQCYNEYSKILHTENIFCSECRKPITIYKNYKKQHNFCSTKCSAIFFNRPRKKIKIIKPPKEKKIVKCKYCGNDTLNKYYCNGTCRNNDQNKYKNGSKSYAEKILCSKIKSNFPNWNIIENDRLTLNGLELDVYIPHLKLAIEWNGIYHIEPIRGNDALQKIIGKDNKKQKLCKELGITLLTISDRTSHKKFIEETTNDLINKLQLLEMAGRVGNAPTLTD